MLRPGLKPLVWAVLSVFVITSVRSTESTNKVNDDGGIESPVRALAGPPTEKRRSLQEDDEFWDVLFNTPDLYILRREVEDFFREFWDTPGITGFGIPPDDLKRIKEAAGLEDDDPKGPATYGEITQKGFRAVARAMGLEAPKGQDKIFFCDLGSGVGKVVVQAYIEFPAVVGSGGIELSTMRYDRSRKAWSAAQSKAVALRTKAGGSDAGVYFGERDMFSDSSCVYVRDATHMYISSTCFPEEKLKQLARCLCLENIPGLKVIATLKPFPDGLHDFEETTTVEAEMSWTVRRGGTNTVHIYNRKAGRVEL